MKSYVVKATNVEGGPLLQFLSQVDGALVFGEGTDPHEFDTYEAANNVAQALGGYAVHAAFFATKDEEHAHDDAEKHDHEAK